MFCTLRSLERGIESIISVKCFFLVVIVPR